MAHLTNEEMYEVLQIEMTNHPDRTVGQWHRYRELQDKADGRDPGRIIDLQYPYLIV